MMMKNKTSLVPYSLTFGLGLFALILSLAGYVLRWLVEPDKMAIIWHALKVVPFFMVVVPALMCAGAYLMNRFSSTNIAMRNAWTLGWLLSVVGLLSIMGVYS